MDSSIHCFPPQLATMLKPGQSEGTSQKRLGFPCGYRVPNSIASQAHHHGAGLEVWDARATGGIYSPSATVLASPLLVISQDSSFLLMHIMGGSR